MTLVLKRKPPSPNAQLKVYRDEVRKDLNKVKDAHLKARRQVVANWSKSTKPTFNGRVTVTAKQIGISITAREKQRNRPIWKWIDKTGTKAHVIRPKASNRRGLLFFQSGGKGSYQSKTSPNPARFGGSGMVRGGKLGVAKSVRHPGFRPRKFSEKINKDLRPEGARAIKNGGARGLRRAKNNR